MGVDETTASDDEVVATATSHGFETKGSSPYFSGLLCVTREHVERKRDDTLESFILVIYGQGSIERIRTRYGEMRWYSSRYEAYEAPNIPFRM